LFSFSQTKLIIKTNPTPFLRITSRDPYAYKM